MASGAQKEPRKTRRTANAYVMYTALSLIYMGPLSVRWLRIFLGWADDVIAVSRVDRVRSNALAMIRVRIVSDVLCSVASQREVQR